MINVYLIDVGVCEASDSPKTILLLLTTAAPVSSQLVSIPRIVERGRKANRFESPKRRAENHEN